jgi:hypothetical protein
MFRTVEQNIPIHTAVDSTIGEERSGADGDVVNVDLNEHASTVR